MILHRVKSAIWIMILKDANSLWMTTLLILMMALALIPSNTNSNLQELPIVRLDVLLNGNVTLGCNFDKPVVCTWQRNYSYTNLNIGSSRYILPHALENPQKVTKDCSLIIKNVSKIDSAIWTCTTIADSTNPGSNPQIEYWINVKTDEYIHKKPILQTELTTRILTVLKPTNAPIITDPVNHEPKSTVKTQSFGENNSVSADISMPILIASATSGGILALFILLGLTIFACYRCKKPRHPPPMLPMKYYGEMNAANMPQYRNVFSRDSCISQPTMMDFKDSSSITSSHFYEEIPTNFIRAHN